MLTFDIRPEAPSVTKEVLEKMTLYDQVQVDRLIELTVDGRIFFSETISIYELAHCCQKWLKEPPEGKWWKIQKNKKRLKNTKDDFIYNTIENEENPLLAFYKTTEGWKMFSVWQKFECDNVFSDEEVENFINEIISQVVF